ncbi:DUF5133 domain-containing protein [Streptomyces erythrochromogenes]
MALVPCTAARSRRIVPDAARSAGAGPDEVAAAVLAMRVGEPMAPAVDEAPRRVLVDARPLPTPATASWMPPRPDVLRRHVTRLRAARRRAVEAPDDAGVRGALENAAYTLCILMEQRSTHGALLAAEALIAVYRLDAPADRPPQRSGQGRGVPPVALTISPVM